MISAYIEAVRSNAANARVHISISFDRNLPDAVYTYYRSDNGRRLAKLIKENFINAGITLEFKPASFYILSSTSAVTAVINLNPDTIKIHNNHIISKINFALVKAVKLYFNKF